MNEQERIKRIAEELQQGLAVPTVSVREFLSWFDAQRRTYWNKKRINDTLSEFSIRTEPDYLSTWIDGEIGFVLDQVKDNIGQFETKEQNDQYESSGSSTGPSIDEIPANDPAYRISKLEAANKRPVCVKPNTSLEEAITIMLLNGFSHIPVMTSDRDVKGIITWTSIGSRLVNGLASKDVQAYMDQHEELRADESFFQLIQKVQEHEYVLIRGANDVITGIVTSSDLSIQFKILTEPFLLLGEIENYVRWVIGNNFTPEELRNACLSADESRAIKEPSDMNFGEYIRLLQDPNNWTKLGISLDRKYFCSQLERVRST